MRVSLFLLAVLAAVPAFAGQAVPPAVFEQYNAASASREARLRGASMDVAIDATVPKLKKSAHLNGLRRISNLGKVTYEAVQSRGDAMIRKYVIARYLSSEAGLQADPQGGKSRAVTPANYRFGWQGESRLSGRRAYILSVRPKQKREGLYRGRIWVDAETGMPIREAGRLYASSVFLKRIDFVRDYRFQDDVAVPAQLSVEIDTRIAGKAELTVAYTNFKFPELVETAQHELRADLQ